MATGERATFEESMRKKGWGPGLDSWNAVEDRYMHHIVNDYWQGWQLAAAYYTVLTRGICDGVARLLEGNQ